MSRRGAQYNRNEQKQAKNDNAKPVKNSGRGVRKGDALRGFLMVDYKFTESNSFSINIDAWKKLNQQAYAEGYEPTIVVVFENHNDRELAIVDWQYLKDLEDKVEDFENGLGN